MVKQQPSRKAQLLDALRSGSAVAGLTLLLLLPAALLIRDEVFPERGAEAAVQAAACISAMLTEAIFFAGRRAGYIFVPLSALTAALLFLLFGACLPVTGWGFGCLWKAACAMTAGMSMVYLIKMNKNNKKTQRKRTGHYR